jgi:cell wall integrity and stress response component
LLTYLGQTVVVTASGAATSDSSSGSSSGPNKAGIAAGVVVGIIAIGAIAGGIFFYLRAQRRKEVEDEYKRQAAISSFVGGGKPGSSAGASHDTRLDPVIMTQRRMSDGSIADNQDYSRRILKVRKCTYSTRLLANSK